MNHHTDMQKLLAAYAGDDLEPSERVRLEQHLAECASCRAELADLQTVLRLIRTIPGSEPPAWLATRIMARVREQQRAQRRWWQRIFVPLRIKLPLEAAALLLICVSGYYLARDVETGLQQPAIQRELPVATTEAGKPAGAPQPEVPAAAPPASAPLPTTNRELPPGEQKTAQPSSPQQAVQGAPRYLPAPPGKPAPQPAFAPPPPVLEEERNAPADESPAGDNKSFRTDRGAAPAGHVLPPAAMKKNIQRKGDQDMTGAEATRATSAPAGAALPQISIRIYLNTPAAAHGALTEAVIRSGGSVLADPSSPPDIIKARIPAVRMDELLDRLGRLGGIAERPQTRNLAGTIMLEIVW